MCPRKGNPATPVDPSFYKELLDEMSDGVYFVDRDRRILYWNKGATRLTGYTTEELVGRRCHDDTLCHVDERGKRLCLDGCPLAASMEQGAAQHAQVFLRHKQGRRVPVAVRVQPIRAADGSITGAVEIFSDATAQHAARRRTEDMERLAFLDQVTQLPNRRYLEMSLETALNEFKVHKDPFGLLVLDLDRFKTINDEFGHAAGDRALCEVATTLARALRPTDIVGRWGGDEFLAIVGHVNDETLGSLAQRCCALARQTSFPSGDVNTFVSISVSVGAALAMLDDTSTKLINRADKLMYDSKASGRGCVSMATGLTQSRT